MKITQSKSNGRNDIKCTRISVYDAAGDLVDSWEISTYNAIAYCRAHPTGKHGVRLSVAIAKCIGRKVK